MSGLNPPAITAVLALVEFLERNAQYLLASSLHTATRLIERVRGRRPSRIYVT